MPTNRKQIYSGKIVKLFVDRVEIQGESYLREVVQHPGGVVILAELEDNRIPFVRQLRYPLNKVLLELPAGKLEPGEDPRAGAAREMEEETGLRPLSLEHVFSFYPTPGFCDEILHLYYTTRLEPSSMSLEKDEEIVLEFHSLEEALEMSLRAEIMDGKTLMALFWLLWRKGTTTDN